MSSNVGKKHIAHTGSGHGIVFPSAVSLLSPPAPPAPTPFPYTGRASNAKDTDSKIVVNGSETVLIEKSTIPLDPPANQPSQAGGGDVVTHAVKNIATMQTGSYALTIRGKGICATGDMAALNVMSAQSPVAQAQVPLLEAGDFELARESDEAAAYVNEEYARAYPPSPAKRAVAGHPVDLATGHVVDEATDLELPGFIPLVWSRSYASAGRRSAGALGKGGWSHAFEQRIEIREGGIRFFDENGTPVDFAPLDREGRSFHRGDRLELAAIGRGYEIRSLESRLVRDCSALPGGRIALREIRDAWGHRITLSYEDDVLARIVDTVGREIRLTNDAKGRVTRVEVWASEPGSDRPKSLQTWFDYAYHPEGELASHTNALGHAEGWEYDGLHRMVRAALRNGVAFHYEYHPEIGYCSRTWGDGGLHDVQIEIDIANGETRTAGTNRARRYLWKAGVVHREETFDGAWSVERRRDADGLLVATVNGAGEAFEREHDARGNLVAAADPAGNVWRWEIADDRARRMIEPTGLVTTCEYDALGALVAAVFPTGHTVHLERDREGRIAAIHDAGGVQVRLAYDEHSNVASETSARGAKRAYRHDAMGRLVESADALGRQQRFTYDVMGRVTEVTRADGTRIQVASDRLGNLAAVTDAEGRTTTLDHEGTGRLCRVVLPDGQVYRLRHDSDERLVEIVNPRLETYRIDYDRADRVVAERTFDGRLVTYRHDAAGRVARVDHPEGEWREYRYDKLGRVVEDRGDDVRVRFERDALGRVLTAVCEDVTGKVTTQLERDPFGRITADIQDGRAVRYEHDAEGRRTARVLPNGDRTEYRYDLDGALAGLTHGDQRLVVERDALGRERRRSMGGWSMEIDHDAMDRLSVQKVGGLGASGDPRMLAARRYGYDAVGRPTSIESLHGGNTVYHYDALGQLLQATRGGREEAFEYDPTGSLVNRRSEIGAGPGEPWSFAQGNRLRATGRARYVNDDRGRRIQRLDRPDGKDPRRHPPSGDERVTTYGWDSKNRLREVARADTSRVRFSYDAFGRRVRKLVLGPADPSSPLAPSPEKRTVTFLWDGEALCEEVDSAKPEGARRRVHAHQPGTFVPVVEAQEGRVFGVITDHLATPKELVDDAGRVAWRADHGAWGDVARVDRDAGAADVESPFRLLGQVSDPDVDLTWTLYRCFDPEAGRWLTPDPLGIEGGKNLFAFDGAPTAFVDPYGLCADEPPILFGQKRAAPKFRDIAPNPQLAGKTLAEVAELIKSGKIHPDDVVIHYFVHEGRNIADNNRGLAVLAMAGMQPTNVQRVETHPDFRERLSEGTRTHPLPNPTLPLTTQKDGTGVVTVVDLRG